MKKFLALTLAALMLLALLAGCGDSGTLSEEEAEEVGAALEEITEELNEALEETEAALDAAADKVITVGASSTPHAEILEQVKDVLAEDGWTLDIVVYDDYVLPNEALDNGDLDANYFQHSPYLNSFNASNGTNLAAAALVHYEPFGIYSNDVTDLAELADGATILIPADDSNETRALFLLQQEGLITLPEDANPEYGVTTLDIVDDGGYNIVAVQADTVPSQLDNADAGTIAVINGNYALEAGLHSSDALALEDASGDAAQTYANVIACRAGEEDSEKITALVNAVLSDSVKEYIADTYEGAVVAIF